MEENIKEENIAKDNVAEENTAEENITEEAKGESEAQPADEVEVIDETEKRVAEAEAKAAEMLDKFQRTLAEFDNFRKRTIKEKAQTYDNGVRDTVEKILPVIDNFERAVTTYKGDTADGFYKGVEMIYKQFNDYLASLGVEEIPALGETFDPKLHSAMAHEENEEYGESEITAVMLKGYKYKDKVIRHSMVKVAN